MRVLKKLRCSQFGRFAKKEIKAFIKLNEHWTIGICSSCDVFIRQTAKIKNKSDGSFKYKIKKYIIRDDKVEELKNVIIEKNYVAY